ncbi:MAG: hypothetical protein LUC37_06980 [Prevotella sp.]|nr:hypothetical protein [Prevotella sp.]
MQIINRIDDFDFIADPTEDLKLQVEDFYKMYGRKPDVEIEDKNITITFSNEVEKKIKEDAPRNYSTYYYGLVCFYKNLGVYREAFIKSIEALKYSVDRPKFPGVKEKIQDLTFSLSRRITLDTDIPSTINTLKEDIAEKLELPLDIIQDTSMSLAGKLEYAPTYGRGKHILYYNQKRNSVLHTILHELTHLEMNNAAARRGKNMIFYFSQAQYEIFRNRHSDFIKDLKEKRGVVRSQQVRRLFEGYNLCLLNTPLDLFVEWKIFNKYTALQPIQF